jgi:hypothetical protein
MNSSIEYITIVHFAFFSGVEPAYCLTALSNILEPHKVATEGVPIRRNESFCTTECSLAFALGCRRGRQCQVDACGYHERKGLCDGTRA